MAVPPTSGEIQSRSKLQRYSAALLAVVLAAIVRALLDPVLGPHGPTLLFILASCFAAAYGGFGPGVFASFVGSITGILMFLEPRFSLTALSNASLIMLMLSILTGVEVSFAFEVRERARRRLFAREQQLRLLTNLLPEAMAHIDNEFRYKYVNSAYAALLERPPEDLYGRRLDEVLEPGMWALVNPQLASALRGESVHCEMTLPNQQRTMMASYTPEFGADGQVNGVAALLVDITERKKIEAALVRAEKFAATGRLAATIAHEINNPLESLTNLLYLLQHDDSLPESARAHLKVADKELARVSDLTRQTLSFYRPQRACIRLDISVLLGEVLSLYAERLHRKHIKTNIEDESVTVAWIEGELRQIFSNIIANAIDALPAGGKMHIRITSTAGRAMIEFSDNGTGIREEDLPHIFDPFFTTKEVYGTGLGLWVTRELLEKHGGTIAVSSSTSPETRGTTVLVMLPAVEQRVPVSQTMRVS